MRIYKDTEIARNDYPLFYNSHESNRLNKFSISTSELAQSLQRSAGTLKIAGNTIDEAIAMTVAGNEILRDPNTVGQALKTVALRLQGTSIEDMQKEGEEIDGLITTQAKLRKAIMDATKVKSNQYQGIDILDENGNYLSTYKVLLKISEIFKEIQEEDKQFSTNRASFLTETLGGKTRASSVSSVLLNYNDLIDVYE